MKFQIQYKNEETGQINVEDEKDFPTPLDMSDVNQWQSDYQATSPVPPECSSRTVGEFENDFRN